MGMINHCIKQHNTIYISGVLPRSAHGSLKGNKSQFPQKQDSLSLLTFQAASCAPVWGFHHAFFLINFRTTIFRNILE